MTEPIWYGPVQRYLSDGTSYRGFELGKEGDVFYDLWKQSVTAENWPVVIVESPFSGEMEANRRYAIRACLDCMRRQEVPYASHLFFPQFLDELKPEEREQGLTAGYAMWKVAVKIVFYCDLGWSPGMQRAYERAAAHKLVIENRFCNGVKE